MSLDISLPVVITGSVYIGSTYYTKTERSGFFVLWFNVNSRTIHLIASLLAKMVVLVAGPTEAKIFML